MKTQARAVVVGGGAVGTGIAYHLAQGRLGHRCCSSATS